MSFVRPRRVLGVDIGVWTFSYCILEGDAVTDWRVMSIPAVAGFPRARERVKFEDITQAMLIEIAYDAMKQLFPPDRVRHDFDMIAIESQPRKRGKATKMAEFGMAIFRYFHEAAQHEDACCWRFPIVRLIQAKAKFAPADFLGLATEGTPKGTPYPKRKAYAVKLVTRLLTEKGIACPDELRERFLGARKADDLADALLMAAIGAR